MVLIPFVQGNVFRHTSSYHTYTKSYLGLNPFRTGQCLSTFNFMNGMVRMKLGLNPFRTGQCLSTNMKNVILTVLSCLNPFRTGQCLSTYAVITTDSSLKES